LLKGFDKKGHASELLFSDECKSAWKEKKWGGNRSTGYWKQNVMTSCEFMKCFYTSKRNGDWFKCVSL
jgi:hypothetical protein